MEKLSQHTAIWGQKEKKKREGKEDGIKGKGGRAGGMKEGRKNEKKRPVN